MDLRFIRRVTALLDGLRTKPREFTPLCLSANSIADAMFETLSDRLRGNTRILSSTISSILQVRILGDPFTRMFLMSAM